MWTSMRSMALLVAGTVGIAIAFVVPSDDQSIAEIHTSTFVPCANYRCTSSDITTIPKSVFQHSKLKRDTSIEIRESSLAITDTSLAIRDTSIALRDLLPLTDEPHSTTTTTTLTAPIVTSTMALNLLSTPVDGTQFSTTLPWGSIDTISTTSSVTITVVSSRPATITTHNESTLSTKPPPIIISTRPFVTTSTASTNVTTPASNLSTSAILSNTVISYCNGTCPTGTVPVVTSYDLTTVDASTDTSSQSTPTSSESRLPSNTGFVQNSGKDMNYVQYKIRGLSAVALLVNFVFTVFM